MPAITVADGLEIMPRRAWAGDSRPATGPINSEDVRFLLVHHTASANGADPIATMRVAYKFHTGPEKGWPDVAYNFFIDQNGVVYEGRTGSLDGPVEASATGGSQGYAQLVCLLGDFTAVLPTEAALSSLERTLVWLADRYRVDTTPGATTSFVSRGSNRWPEGSTIEAPTIAGHRDMSQTACPGDTFYPFLRSTMTERVDALRGDTAPDSEVPTPSSVSEPPGPRVGTGDVAGDELDGRAPVPQRSIPSSSLPAGASSPTTGSTASTQRTDPAAATPPVSSLGGQNGAASPLGRLGDRTGIETSAAVAEQSGIGRLAVAGALGATAVAIAGGTGWMLARQRYAREGGAASADREGGDDPTRRGGIAG